MHLPRMEATDASGGLLPQHRDPGQVSGNQEKKSLGWGHCSDNPP